VVRALLMPVLGAAVDVERVRDGSLDAGRTRNVQPLDSFPV